MPRMVCRFGFVALLLALLLPAPAVTQEKDKAPAAPSTGVAIDKKEMAERVKQEFLHAWNAYKAHAWGHDDLRPLTKTYRDWHDAPLLMTAVDAMSTMHLMGLEEEAKRTREFVIANLRFDHSISVKNFEITIRILGGLLSAHQLSGDVRLLSMAEDLGRRLLPAFDSPTGMPYMYVNIGTGSVHGNVSNPAEIGTLLIEFGTLSKLTGKPEFYDKAKRALAELHKRRAKTGLVGSTINIETGAWVSKRSHVGGGIDSYYEYLLKCSILFGDKDCESMWKESVAALNKHVAHQVSGSLWYGQVNMDSGDRIGTRFGALDAFLPAVLALGGDIDRAKRLQESSYKMWQIAGIEPEAIDYAAMKITSPGYPLRPEIMESAYYLYFFTQDPRYLEMGKVFFDGLVQHSRTEAGYAALSNVITKEKADHMESFFLAETLKYLYLLFAPRETLDLTKWVFNTEAHPVRRTW